MDQLIRLQELYITVQGEAEELRRRHNLLAELERTKSEIAIEQAQIHQRLMRDHEERSDAINAAVVLFEELSEAMSEHQGLLTVAATDAGPRFEIDVPSRRSAGVKSMQVFCFDMMVSTLWARAGLGPGFLFHDSHLFDGVDSRQVAKALEIGAGRSRTEGFQYIVTLNSDAIPRDEFSDGFDIDGFVVPAKLEDKTDSGGLFGIRF